VAAGPRNMPAQKTQKEKLGSIPGGDSEVLNHFAPTRSHNHVAEAALFCHNGEYE
jgi:hypothetical protein